MPERKLQKEKELNETIDELSSLHSCIKGSNMQNALSGFPPALPCSAILSHRCLIIIP